MPDTPELQARFGQPSAQRPGCGFPVAKILALFLAGTGLLLEILATPLRSHEMARVSEVHPALKPSDVLVGDRGFCSFTHLVLLANRGVHAVLRMHQRQIVDFTPRRPHARPTDKRAPKGMPRSRWLQQLGVLDQVVEWFRREDPPEWMAQERFAALPETVILRELRYRVGRSGFRTPCVTLVTTLLDDEVYPLEALAEFYGMRWRVEVCQADYNSRYTLYQSAKSSHGGGRGVVGTGKMEPEAPRNPPRSIIMRHSIQRVVPPPIPQWPEQPHPPERALAGIAGPHASGSAHDPQPTGRAAAAIASGGAGGAP
jgi:Transposase DDE domain